jgi:hypothetical protein
MPNMIANIIKERMFVFDITQGFLLVALFLVGIPAFMIFLSFTLPAKVNRKVNIIIASVNIPFIMFN